VHISLTKQGIVDLKSQLVLDDGLRMWTTGSSGSGKSNTNMRIMSQWVQAGRQLILFDAHAEHRNLWSLKPSHISCFGYGDEPVKSTSTDWVMSHIEEGNSVLIDLSHWTDSGSSEMDEFAKQLLLAVSAYARKKPAHRLIALEEAQNFAPQSQSSGQYELVKLLRGLLTGGRKFGLHFLLSSQRASLVDSDVLSQCNLNVLHRVLHPKDWERYKKILPPKFPITFGSKKSARDIQKFGAGEAILNSLFFPTHRGQVMLPIVKVTKFLEEVA
jgi:hypothetical protein